MSSFIVFLVMFWELKLISPQL
uniref:Uncharacterized protein n=1 Tax=Rhizophora mucronata TaxID=61149 RepID=A0A2P2QT97_RHIMU